MSEIYEDTLETLLVDERLQYDTFRDNMHVVPESFQASTSNQLTLSQLTDVANSLDLDRYDGTVFTENELELTADTYDQLGIIGSDVKTFTGETVYKSPDYHGRGGSRSWDDIVAELHETVLEVEKNFSREKRSGENRGLHEFM